MPTTAFGGLRVLELGSGKALAYAGKLLRDLGAEVIKVEPPEGDQLRLHGPFPNDEPDPERSGLFIYFNGGKRGARLDLMQPADRADFEALLAGADALIHSLRPSEAEVLGLSRDRLLAEHPQLVVTAVTAFGHSGPYSEWKGHALQAYAGAAVAYRLGDPEREPLTAPLDSGEIQHGGVHAALCTVLALLHRDRIGRGQFADVSTLEAINVSVWGHGIPQCVYLENPIPQRNGRQLSSGVFGVYACKDGDFAFMTHIERHWQTFIDYLGGEGTEDPLIRSLASASVRRNLTAEENEHIDRLLQGDFAKQLKERTMTELWEFRRRERIPFLPVHTVPEVCESDHAQERGLLVDAPGEHPPLRLPGRHID